MLNEPFTKGIELAVNETLVGDAHYVSTHSDASFGSGALVCGIEGAYQKLAIEYLDKSLNFVICV
jgi:hypothetical protein